MAQVVEPAKQIVAAADLQGVSGGFSFSSCNNQGDPPYMGKVTMSFLLHATLMRIFSKSELRRTAGATAPRPDSATSAQR
jgi:hypothetical protein